MNASSRRGQLNSSHNGFESSTENFAQNWTLDATGNWSEFKQGAAQGTWTIDQDRTHDAANQVGTISGSGGNWADAVHDAAGNMTIMPDGTDPANYKLRATYDAWNRLVKIERRRNDEQDSGWVVVDEFQYDGLNRRTVKEKYAGGTLAERRYYFFDQDWQVLEERLGKSDGGYNYKIDWFWGWANRQYVWGLRYVDDLVIRDDDTEPSVDTGNHGGFNHYTPRHDNTGLDRRLYALQDANWNVVATADYAGAVQERYTYAAYGKAEYRDPTTFALRSPNASTLGWTILYTGCNLDPETGLQINRWRYLHLDLGRFIVPDPIGYTAGLNLYEYCGGDPLTATDPTGEASYTYNASTAIKWGRLSGRLAISATASGSYKLSDCECSNGRGKKLTIWGKASVSAVLSIVREWKPIDVSIAGVQIVGKAYAGALAQVDLNAVYPETSWIYCPPTDISGSTCFTIPLDGTATVRGQAGASITVGAASAGVDVVASATLNVHMDLKVCPNSVTASGLSASITGPAITVTPYALTSKRTYKWVYDRRGNRWQVAEMTQVKQPGAPITF